MNIYNYAGQDFTEDQIEKRATSKGLSLQEYLNQNPEITLISGKAQGSTEDPTMSPNTMGSQLESGSSELPEDKGWFEDMFTAIKGGSAAGSSVGEAFDVYRQGRNISDEDLQRYIEAAKLVEQNPETNEAASWKRDMKKHGGGFLGGFMGLLENPGYFPQFIASSAATMATSFFDSPETAAAAGVGAGTGAVLGSAATPIGTATGAVGGAMAGLVGAMETGLTLTDLLRDELGEKDFNKENIRALLEDKDVMERVKSRAIARGATIGMVEGLTLGFSRGIGSKILSKGVKGISKEGLKTGAKVAAATTGVEMIGGGVGETLGMLAAGQELKGEEIFLEMIGEGKGIVNTSDMVKAAVTKTSYKLSGEETTAAKIKEIIDSPNTSKGDLAIMDIEVTGDKAFDNYVRNKQNDAALETQIDERVDEVDRPRLVELEKQRAKAEADTKKKGIFKVINADTKLESIESEIAEIIGRYEAVDRRTSDVRARKKVAGEVRADMAEKDFQNNLAFAKKHSALYGLEVDDTLTLEQIKKQYGDNAALSDGFVDPETNKIIINKTVAKFTKAVNVGNHELLHGILRKALKEGKINRNLIKDLEVKLGKNNWSKVQQRIIDGGYGNMTVKAEGDVAKMLNVEEGTEVDYLQANPDEYLTLLSDAIAANEIEFNEGLFGSIKELLLPVFRAFGFNKINFDSADGVYDFLKEYNRSIHKGTLSSAIVKATEGKVDIEGRGEVFAKSNVQGILAEYGGKEATKPDLRRMINETLIKTPQGQETFDITKSRFGLEVEPIVEAITKRLYDKIPNDATRAAGLTRADYKNALVSEAATMTQQEYNPTVQDLDKFISSRLNLRAESLAKRLGVQEKILKDIDFVTETDIDVDAKPKPKKQPKIIKKGRKLTSLADLDVESSPLIKTSTKIQLKKIIKSNPKNLIEEIQKILIPDLVEIIRKEMGVIGEKAGKLNIPDTYLAYLSDTYRMTISSMEIQKIRSNYKNLFTKEKMGFADYKTKKTDKPSLKKDSNYRKDVYKNTTTPAEFIKYHTEGKKNKLIANQRNLAIMRAEAEAVRASENYLIDNSENLNDVYAAELRNFIDSKTIQKQKLEDKSFDSVKYSKSLALAAFEVRDAVLTGENVFDNNGNLVGSYKNILKNKKDSKAVGDFVYANMHLLTPETDFKFLRKAYEKLYNDDRGTAYETNLIEVSKLAEKIYGIDALEVVLRKPTEKDALPDMILKIHGKVMNIEAKMALAQYSSVTNSIVDGKMVVEKQYSPEFMKILAELQKESQKGIKKAKKFLKENKIEWDGIKLLSTEGHNMLINNIDPDTGSSYFNGMSATLPLPLKFISEIYNNKKHPVFLMQLMGRGLFSMGGDTFNLGIPALEDGGNGFITLRVGSNSQKRVATQADVDSGLVKSIYTDGTNTKKKGEKKTKRQVKTGMKSYSYRSIPGISDNVLNDMKSTHNIENLAGMMKLMDSKEVGNLKMSISAKNKQALNKAVQFSRSSKKESKGITVLDFDDTLATTKSLVKYTTPDGKTGTLNAEEFASTYEDLQDKGYTFDFSDFNKVVKGKLAPLFQKALKLQKKFGPENMFVLTARPPAAQKAIFDFLKANGLNIPVKNITGLGNSTAEAKALWIADKVGEGYNDFYFADDALQNVQAVKNMLDQFDVKSKVQQAKLKFSKSMNDDFNSILENVTGIDAAKRFSSVKARKRGESKGKFRFFIPPSHEDFVGLLYNFIGKGKEGNAHRDFFEKALIRPLNRAYRELNAAKQSIANDYKALNKQFPDIKKKLIKKTPDGDFTYQDAVRVYLWDKHGHDISGLSPTDQQNLVDLVTSDSELQAYAETLNTISKQDKYVAPTDSWEAGDIRTDLDDATGRVGRGEFFAEFLENTDVIFSQENLNKIEAAYGADVVSAIKDMLYRIKTGRNRPSGQNALVNKFLNYLNGSVASTMFFNIRSAVLQQMSMVNFINFADNNIIAAAKAFANQKQYWTDWATIFNSDFMKQRRKGIQTDVNGAELAASVKRAKNPIQAAIKKLLELGFLPTQIGDNIAIATGGATFLRNRINTYLKQGLSQKEAEAKAFVDFEILAEATQQSARPDMVSQQQASPLGKIILAFQNVTSQFNRLGKKAFLDIKNRRITPGNPTQLQSDMSNLSRIAYYFAIQNLVFYSLQSALFMMMFDDNEDDERFLKKKERMINGSIDSVLRGSGVWGSAIATLKNMAIKWHEQRDKGYNADESAVLMEMLNVSPPLGIKARKLVNAEKTLNYNKKTIDEMETFDIDNPMWSAVTSYTEATTNVPLNRLYNKTMNVRESLNNQHSAFERALLFGGWSKWNLGIEDVEKSKKKQEFGGKKKTYKRTVISKKSKRKVINR